MSYLEIQAGCPVCGNELTVGVGADAADPDVGILFPGFYGQLVEQAECACPLTEEQLDAISEEYYTEREQDCPNCP